MDLNELFQSAKRFYDCTTCWNSDCRLYMIADRLPYVFGGKHLCPGHSTYHHEYLESLSEEELVKAISENDYMKRNAFVSVGTKDLYNYCRDKDIILKRELRRRYSEEKEEIPKFVPDLCDKY